MSTYYEIEQALKYKVRPIARRLDFRVSKPSLCWFPKEKDAKCQTYQGCPFHQTGECQLLSTVLSVDSIDPKDIRDCMKSISPHCPLQGQLDKVINFWEDDLTGLQEVLDDEETDAQVGQDRLEQVLANIPEHGSD